MVTTGFLPILGPEPGTRPCVTHVAFATLVDYVRGLGTPAAREHVREHLSSCPHCEKAAGRLTRLAEIAAAEIDCEVPDDVVDEAIALFASNASDRRALSDLDGFFADRDRSRYDDAEAATPSQPHFLRFAAPGGEIDVHLLVIEESGVVSVSGQIVARTRGAPVDWEVSAHRGPGREAIVTTRATAGGLFQLRYDAPAMALLRFSKSGASEAVDVPIDAHA
jgi:anti-sigma factor RsiW